MSVCGPPPVISSSFFLRTSLSLCFLSYGRSREHSLAIPFFFASFFAISQILKMIENRKNSCEFAIIFCDFCVLIYDFLSRRRRQPDEKVRMKRVERCAKRVREGVGAMSGRRRQKRRVERQCCESVSEL
mgnify:CR=1 FL=1